MTEMLCTQSVRDECSTTSRPASAAVGEDEAAATECNLQATAVEEWEGRRRLCWHCSWAN